MRRALTRAMASGAEGRWCSAPSDTAAGTGEVGMPVYNPVTRSGFKPMSKRKLYDMVKQLKKERMEQGQRSDWTQADWEEAKSEGLDTGIEKVSSHTGPDHDLKFQNRLYSKEIERAMRLKGHAMEVIYPDREETSQEKAERKEEEATAAKKRDLVNFFASRIVWEVEEQYRMRLSADDPSLTRKPSHWFAENEFRPMSQGPDARLLQAKYVAFEEGPEREFWHEHHVDVIKAATLLFQQKLWRVRDVAYCDNSCFVFVDNRHAPVQYSVVHDAKKGQFRSTWGGTSQTKHRGTV